MIRRETLRLCLAAIHNEEIARRGALDLATTLAVLGRQAKMRRESIEAFAKGRREDLVTKERAELAVIDGYLPSQLDPSEIRAAAERAIAESGAAGPRDLGKVMQKVMGELRGRADGKVVAAIVGDLLTSERGSGT